MTNILIIGCGGIGSYFIRELHQLWENDVKGLEDIEVTMVDGDEVEEKNLRYQNFSIDDLGLNKAIAMQKRHPFQAEVEYIENDVDLRGYDIIVIAVDNGKLRDLVYQWCDKTNDYFIDMRAEGKAIAVYTSHKANTLEELRKTIDVEKPSTSCQLKYELDNGIIQVGNRVVAMIGIQMLLNKMRNTNNPAKLVQRF